ncbi:hypothetical protein QC760_010014 [Botrytis cinerea]
MARHRDSRSPSPTGSHHSSRRNRRDDNGRRDRDRRDDVRGQRRSRSPDRRERDRDMNRRRDRSVGRLNDDYHRSGRRERSRDRRSYADRERSPDRRRRRSRERDYRDRGDETRGQTPRSDAGAKINDAPKVSTPAVQTEEQKKAERLAKLEAWKKKMAEDKERKEKELAAGGTRKLLDAIDQKANGSPSLTSPNSPTTPATPATPGDLAPPTNYAGKFDPKAIAKKAVASSSSAHTLGKDLPLKELSKAFQQHLKSICVT